MTYNIKTSNPERISRWLKQKKPKDKYKTVCIYECDLSKCKTLVNVFKALQAYQNLKTLIIRNCRLDVIPTGLMKDLNLSHLDVQENSLTEIPVALLNHTRIRKLALGGNPIPYVDARIIKSCRFYGTPLIKRFNPVGMGTARGQALEQFLRKETHWQSLQERALIATRLSGKDLDVLPNLMMAQVRRVIICQSCFQQPAILGGSPKAFKMMDIPYQDPGSNKNEIGHIIGLIDVCKRCNLQFLLHMRLLYPYKF